MRPRRLATTLLLSAVLLSGAPASGADPEELRRTFLQLINAERERLGLQPLVLAPGLIRAAQAHAEDMSARGYAGFSSPEGRTTEDWAHQAGYKFQMITAKLAFTADPPEAIARGWKPDSSRQSLFHPDARDLGIGIGAVRGTPIYSFLLARSEESYLERYMAELYERQTLALQKVEPLREEILQRVNEIRLQVELHPLIRHPALDRAAQVHAEAVLRAIRAGRPLKTAGPLIAKVRRQKYQMAGLVGERIVTDALNPEQALAQLLDEGGESERSTLLGTGFTEMGIGLAFERTREGFSVVWVQCTARPLSPSTGADSRQEAQEGPGWETTRRNPGGEHGEGGGDGPP
jgi:uncharacterized protein YkwD